MPPAAPDLDSMRARGRPIAVLVLVLAGLLAFLVLRGVLRFLVVGAARSENVERAAAAETRGQAPSSRATSGSSLPSRPAPRELVQPVAQPAPSALERATPAEPSPSRALEIEPA